jgi:hypothetical protein
MPTKGQQSLVFIAGVGESRRRHMPIISCSFDTAETYFEQAVLEGQ